MSQIGQELSLNIKIIFLNYGKHFNIEFNGDLTPFLTLRVHNVELHLKV